MTSKLEALLDQIKVLEIELIDELQKQQEEFLREMYDRQGFFEASVIARHKKQVKRLYSYITEAPLGHILTAPFIWLCLFPMLAVDASVSLYQAVCFPVYGIPRVKRQDYVVFDRRFLNYLNLIEKMNCAYCSYANGLFAYVGEIAARTEQFWCPIKHASRIRSLHSRYQKFIDYGDAETYRAKVQTVRRDFSDLQP